MHYLQCNVWFSTHSQFNIRSRDLGSSVMSPVAFSHASGVLLWLMKGVVMLTERRCSSVSYSTDWNGPSLNINSGPVFLASRDPHYCLCVLLPVPPGWSHLLQTHACRFTHLFNALNTAGDRSDIFYVMELWQ